MDIVGQAHRRSRFSSVRNKTILIMVVSLVPSLIISAIIGGKLLQMSSTIAKGEISRLSQNVATQCTLVTQNAQQLLRILSAGNSVAQRNVGMMHTYFTNLVQENPQYATILATDRTGKVIAAGIPKSDYSLSDRQYFKEVLASKRFVVGSYVHSRGTTIPVIPFALPVFDKAGEIDLVLIVSLKVSSISQTLSSVTLPEGSLWELWDSDGNCLFRIPESTEYPAGVPGDPVLKEIVRRAGDRIPIAASIGHRNMLIKSESIILMPDPKTSFRIVVAVPAGVSFNTAMKLLLFLSMIVLSLGFSLVMSSWLYSSSIGNRLETITKELHSLAAPEEIPNGSYYSNDDEIDLLYRTLRKTSLALQRREQERDEALQTVQAELKEKETLLKEIHHRVKNNFQIISSLLSLQSMSVEDPNILRMFEESRNRILSMALIHEKLYRSESISQIDFGQYAKSMAEQIATTYADVSDRISVSIKVGETPVPLETAVPLGLILNETLSNCFKHAFKDREHGDIEINMLPQGDHRGVLEVSDDGVGLKHPEQLAKQGTLGMELIQNLTKQIDGTLKVESPVPGRSGGTRITLSFPLPDQIEWIGNAGSKA